MSIEERLRKALPNMNKEDKKSLKALFKHEFPYLIETFKNVIPIKNENHQYSALESMRPLSNQQKTLIRLYTEIPYWWRKSIVTADRRYNHMVPIFMSIQKEHNNIMYEEWSKIDRPELLTGTHMLNNLNKAKEITMAERRASRNLCIADASNKGLDWRKNATIRKLYTESGAVEKYLGYSLMGVYYASGDDSEYMIMDANNWDAFGLVGFQEIREMEELEY